MSRYNTAGLRCACHKKFREAAKSRLLRHVLICEIVPVTRLPVFADAGARPLQWGMAADCRAVCLRFTPNNKEESTAPWSCPIAVDFPAGKDRHVAIPIRPPTSAAASASGTDGRAPGHKRSISTVLTAAGPAWQLEGSDVVQRLKHIAR